MHSHPENAHPPTAPRGRSPAPPDTRRKGSGERTPHLPERPFEKSLPPVAARGSPFFPVAARQEEGLSPPPEARIRRGSAPPPGGGAPPSPEDPPGRTAPLAAPAPNVAPCGGLRPPARAPDPPTTDQAGPVEPPPGPVLPRRPVPRGIPRFRAGRFPGTTGPTLPPTGAEFHWDFAFQGLWRPPSMPPPRSLPAAPRSRQGKHVFPFQDPIMPYSLPESAAKAAGHPQMSAAGYLPRAEMPAPIGAEVFRPWPRAPPRSLK